MRGNMGGDGEEVGRRRREEEKGEKEEKKGRGGKRGEGRERRKRAVNTETRGVLHYCGVAVDGGGVVGAFPCLSNLIL